ncbi:uncharacterized protein mslnb isoform X3 [Fundulus heteroclitus]|uniref:uncharacterized protein mslnb isoform X2 n=1 Tax=Fundulus heteroclitus TaxID=8078 RepID=UPI00165B9775|nr:uncharacterized protein mslnb isoform X2 [Fundulus heteroclitus]XP_035993295.1 uncharacterized protein mslnb isoform X3 [Fundulus heteroclitus]
MKSHHLFLLVYLFGATLGESSAEGNTKCETETCGLEPDATSRFLRCVGLPPTDTGKDHVRRLKAILEGTMDVYTFMKSSLTGVPILGLEGALALNAEADPLQNEALVEMWLEVQIKPLLGSITKHFLSCLSTKNFSCSTYQTVVRELSRYYSDMNSVRQKWIYTFFMYPFLSGDRVAGCVNPNETTEDWLMKNFGSFRAMARMTDFSSLNMVFSGLEVLHLLSPAQKAELLMRPEVAGLDNGTLTLVFDSLLPGGSGHQRGPSPGNTSMVPSGYSYPQNRLSEIANGFMMALRPIGSFAHEFVSFTRQRNVSEIKSTTLTQFLLNWTLAELADVYTHDPSVAPEPPQFDVTNVEDWYQQVVLPLLRRILSDEEALMHQNVTLAFHELYFLEHGEQDEYDEIQDVCSITLDKAPCGLTDAVENMAHILQCAARSELTLTETTIIRLITELAERLNSLVQEFSITNFAELASDIEEIFNENESPALTQHHLEDPEFIKLWFRVKLLPLLPGVNPDLLSCLSTKNFSCPVYQTLVAELGHSMMQMDADMMYSHNIYRYFIYPFLQSQNTSEPRCISSANQSAEWVKLNFGFFSTFASVLDFYELNPYFSGLEALEVLSPKQLAEMLLLPLPTPPEKDLVIHTVFDFLLESPENRKFTEVLHFLVQLAGEVEAPCSVYKPIFERLYGAVTETSPLLEPVIWARIDDLMAIAPDCVPANITCPDTRINSTYICQGVDSSDLQAYLNSSADVSCNFTLEKYACAQLEDFTAEQLASLMRCDLPGHSSQSRVLWKLVLTKLSSVLDSSLDMLANVSVGTIPLAEAILDVIGEMRLSALTSEELMNSSVIRLWFAERLSGFLPSASVRVLLCLTSRNFSCASYQQILQVFVGHFEKTPVQQQRVILNNFILRFLQHSYPDPGCLSSFNNSAQWLTDNLGPFSEFVLVSELLRLNPLFEPLEVIQLLTPKQRVELLALKLPVNTDMLINMLFDYMSEAPEERGFTEFLSQLVMFTQMGNLSCSSYKTLFTRLDAAMVTASSQIASSITYTKFALSKQLPDDCIIYREECDVTFINETALCTGVNSTKLQVHLDSGMMAERFCTFSVEEIACASLSGLTAQNLATILSCDRPSNSSGTKAAWKLLLSKASIVLDSALDLLTNTTLDPSNPSASMILDSIRELRLDLLNMAALSDPAIIQLWFGRRLRPFLPAVSNDFLSCLATNELNCSTYQHIVQILSEIQPHMMHGRQMSVFTHFISVFLTRNNSADPGCLSSFNNSAQWLTDNLGPFSEFVLVSELLRLNPLFKPLEVIQLLTPKQRVELLALKLPVNTDMLINMLFDYMSEAPEERGFTEFLSQLVMFTEMGNLSCSSYKTLFIRLDAAMVTASSQIASSITYTKMALSKQLPDDCIIYRGECNVTMINETNLCTGVNSTKLQLLLDSGMMAERFCTFSVEEIACASLSGLTAQNLATILSCDRPSNSSGTKAAWKLLLSKTVRILNDALDLLTNTMLDPSSPSASMILDSIRELRLDVFNMAALNDPTIIQLWFGRRLRPFLPAVSNDFLLCLATKELSCNTYQNIVKLLSEIQPRMTHGRQMSVFTHFISVFLTRNNSADPFCSSNTNNSGEWVQKNLGGFSIFVTIQELQLLYPNFMPGDALAFLSVEQLVALSITPGQLTSADQVNMVMKYVPDLKLASFFDGFSAALTGNELTVSSAVRSAMLEVVFNRANLSRSSVDDAVVSQWLQLRLPPLLINLTSSHVTPYFQILMGRNCSIERQGVMLLNSTIHTLSAESKKEIHNHIVLALKGPPSLRCYGDNYNNSFYSFVEDSFMGFQFPNLTTFVSLMPRDRKTLLVNSIPPSHLGNFLRRPDVIDSQAQLCDLYSSYVKTPLFLETESLPDGVRRVTLPCVWPVALRSSSRSEVNAWFDRRLQNYLVFLSKSLITPAVTQNTSCLAFQKLVSVLGKYNYTGADFVRLDVFNTIRAYLQSATTARCYDPNSPDLNSTAWFAEYIGPFMPFLTLEILQTFGSNEALQVFTVNPLNIALLNHSVLPKNLTDFYTELIYQQDSNFNPILLPLLCRCIAPGMAFTQLTREESLIMLENLTNVCVDLDPQISAALTSNFGGNVDSNVISALGNESTSLSTGQIKAIKAQDLEKSLSILSNVNGWGTGQARTIISSLMTRLTISTSASLTNLGSLVIGVPTRVFSRMNPVEVLTASKNPSLVGHMLSAPSVVQDVFVNQLTVSRNSDLIVENVPDQMATRIPRVLLQSFTTTSSSNSVITRLNRKTWKRKQAEMFFGQIAVEESTTILGGANNLSSSVLQGFTCTSVRTVKKAQIKNLVKACRRRGSNKVKLEENQLTCMYNQIRGESDITSFELYPPDVLLYYNYSLVPRSSCKAYFEQLSEADFSVFSSSLSYKRSALFDNARSCLNITSTNLTGDQIAILGNMCCYLNETYILKSDESLLEKLKSCQDLSVAQAGAVQTRLISGTVTYGPISTWTDTTLRSLGSLPLYMNADFYDNIAKSKTRTFLKYYLKFLRDNGVSRAKRRRMRAEIRRSIRRRAKRAADIECTVGNITQVTISDATFPFDYDDINQFNSCLSAATVRDNLEAITKKVDQEDYLKIVLTKLRQAYAANIPEDQVQVLGAASRVASLDEINSWNITQVDTLAELMDTTNGEWDPSLAKAIISKYLGVAGNTLGRAELNAIGGPNLCSLDVEVLGNISQEGLRDADALVVSNCTTDKLRVLFNIANQAFQSRSRALISPSLYQLLQPYLGGAPADFVRNLSISDINMDLDTFINLDNTVVQNLTVSEVRDLLGTHLPDLKSFENTAVVKDWISKQLQSELDQLGINLVGGRVVNTATTASATNKPINAVSTTTKPTTTAAGAQIQGDFAGFTFLVFLALLISSQQVLI